MTPKTLRWIQHTSCFRGCELRPARNGCNELLTPLLFQ